MRIFVLTIALVLGSLQLGSAEALGEGYFEADGEYGTVKRTNLENFNSDSAHEALEVSSDLETAAFVQPAWIGDDPGDLGPLWIIQDQDDQVLGACWAYYEEQDLECISLYVPLTFSLY